MVIEEETKASLLSSVKIDKGVTDNSLDDLLGNFINQAGDLVCLYVGEDQLPDQLNSIVVRMVEAHYVQSMTDADGAKTYSEEGASWSFNDSELKPYMALLDRYISNRDGSGSRGGVWSW